ncbi:conserved exported hypothetical protein [Sphingomonas sp. EC-HK361]|uniref:sulfur globule protein precursor n=1 Tax=Sphingomonas sp. EC-HK361 TaxID=2038397 RepID=UPI0012539DD6|nr:sulfur globule protein precursor [Sphingomonas sp. EC-HK361]VVS95836.1 conserved exported hypothetical protein [Sphingomonas sp. EC-HK361]
MKILALTAAGLLSAMALTPIQADAQPRHGWHGDRGWHGSHGWRGHRGWDRGRHYGWRGGRYYRGGYGGYYRPRGRVVCRIHRGYYGPVRRCSRVW